MTRLLTLSFLLTLMGCDRISEEMRKTACDRDGDSHLRDDDYCNQVDNGQARDCDDNDANVHGQLTWFQDGDNDNYGGTVTTTTCPADMPGGYVASNGDCDDTNSAVSPDVAEVTCDQIDNDCNGSVDDVEEPLWYADDDGDTFGDPENTINACEQPEGYTTDASDCDDSDATINTDADETCGDGIDNDCNSIIDDAEGSIIWYADTDNDTYGDPDNATAVCDSSTPEGHVGNDEDCDDTDGDVNPDATEICDNLVDDNCNGTTDDDATTTTWWHDGDNDTFGDPEDTVEDCAPPEGYVDNDEDCDDSESTTNPDAEEVCFDSIDNNCDGDGNDCVLSGTITASDADSRFLGTNDDEYAGETLISVGDIDGSGDADLVISAPMNEEGAVYIIFDPSSGDTNLSGADIIFYGETSGDYAGKAITTGDIDNDGITDLVIGSPGADEIYAFHGPISGFSVTLFPEDADITYTSEESGDWAGVSLASGGDMDGDGDCELVMGAYQNTNANEDTNAGAVYVFRGPEDEGTYGLGEGEQIFEGADADTRLGRSLDGSDDIDGDGRVDLLIGGYEANSFTGIAYLIYGDSGDGGTDYAEDFDTLTLTGEASGDYGGWDVTYTGDFDGTGNVSFAISAYKEDTGGTDAGATYLFNTVSGTSLGDADVKFTGEAADDYSGYSIDGGCDVNGDGYDDLIIGAIGDDDAGTDAGAAYLMYGTSSTLTSPFSLASADAKFTGETAGDKLGLSVTCMADTDGYDNVLVGAPYWDNSTTSTTQSGAVYLFQGTTW